MRVLIDAEVQNILSDENKQSISSHGPNFIEMDDGINRWTTTG